MYVYKKQIYHISVLTYCFITTMGTKSAIWKRKIDQTLFTRHEFEILNLQV